MAAKGSNAVRKITKERIAILYDLSKDVLHKDPKLAKEYIKTIRRLSEHHKIRIEGQIRVRICKNCNLPLIPGENAELRVIGKQKRIICRCKSCGRTNTLSFGP